ncbi:DUF4437 domain-containing protein [Zooshikella ganghwensis]|uniref:DUF4437 domain-containing protein n=1 Tax=Zooshikella ganghwensis TaxID=202772 RepID=A0A4P9VU91_9GAMM|nr:DUF4437 domain-containing protein [Zooshikella ganghwensis]RDH45872.1 DUF4437 domain-containing protein [Zooshikella ganghwensis]
MNKITFDVFLLALVITSLPLKAAEYSVIATDKIKWGLLNPLRGDASPKAADLWGDRTKDTATGMLVKFQKGFSSPPHIHNVTYRGVVIEGLMHNDDPTAEKMWMSTGSFWTQPAGESHITAAEGKNSLIYLEIDSGPYLVLSAKKAFDNGERPINVDERNLVWLDTNDTKWLEKSKVQIAYLWGNPQKANGSFVKLPAGFKGAIESENELKAVVVRGKATHQWNNDINTKNPLLPGSFFRSKAKGELRINAETELVLYINSNGRYNVE